MTLRPSTLGVVTAAVLTTVAALALMPRSSPPDRQHPRHAPRDERPRLVEVTDGAWIVDGRQAALRLAASGLPAGVPWERAAPCRFESGLTLASLDAGGVLDALGFRTGDVIRELDERKIGSVRDALDVLRDAFGDHDTAFEVRFFRGSEWVTRRFEVEFPRPLLALLPADPPDAIQRLSEQRWWISREVLRRVRGLPDAYFGKGAYDDGVTLVGLKRGSRLGRMGIPNASRIHAIDGRPVRTGVEICEALAAHLDADADADADADVVQVEISVLGEPTNIVVHHYEIAPP